MTMPEDLKQLAPTGTLRGGVVTAPAASAFFAIRDGGGEVRGVTVDLIRGFASALKLPLALQVYDNSGQVTDAVAKGDCDLAFMPRDAERAKRVDFGPAYYFIESTYLVPAGSSIKSIEEVNQPGRRIVAISNTTTARSARRTAPNASVEEVPSVDRMTEMARQGQGAADRERIGRGGEDVGPRAPRARRGWISGSRGGAVSVTASRHNKYVAEGSPFDGFMSGSDIFELVRWLRDPVEQRALL
jgi:hypothetical protein